MKKSGTVLVIMVIIAVVVACLIGFGMVATKHIGMTDNQISTETAVQKLERELKGIEQHTLETVMGNVGDYPVSDEITADDLPPLENYPLAVTSNADIVLEIFSSPEKAGERTGQNRDSWLIDVARKFNSARYQVNGKTIGIAVRKMDSGMGAQYIANGISDCALYSPSNQIWGEMLKAQNVPVKLETDRLVGNVAGVLLKEDAYNRIIQKYGNASLKNIVEAVVNGELIMGYTNPTKSSSGLNFIVSVLFSFDSRNPFSDIAVSKFEDFQKNIPYVAYTTIQLRDKMSGNDFDALIIEYQSWKNMSDLQRCKFIPYGMRHDNPLYSVKKLSEEEEQALQLFIEFATSEESQKLATEYGFNGEQDYVSEIANLAGIEYIEAQKLFRTKKDPGKSVAAVFVADISGSMDSEGRLTNLKKSLLRSFGFINSKNSIGLVSYSSAVYINLPIAEFDMTQKARFVGAVESLNAENMTATYNAVLVAAKMLIDEKAQNPNLKLKMFVLSDGDCNSGVSYAKMKEIMSGLGIQVYTIGYKMSNAELKNLAQINEGDFINADTDDVVYKIKQLFSAEM